MKRYALVGTGHRAFNMYAKPITERFGHSAQLVGVCDANTGRATWVSSQVGGVPVFSDFDEMINVTKPDRVIITTIDRLHHEFIIRALEAGCDAITEKPMTIDAAKCRAILAAEQRTGRRVIVTFNYRFAPYVARVRELIRDGAIGTILGLDFAWFLDTRHGADYFRRWHRRKKNSGGLFVHKATHHFDMINWWLDDEPRTVFAQGERRVYGPTRTQRGERCSTCQYTATCEFFVDFRTNPVLDNLYFQAEQNDGYYRDGCVFDDEIDIEDTMSATVRYRHGALMSYSLVAHSPYEGWRAVLNGTGGRLELEDIHSGIRLGEPINTARLINRRGETVNYEIPRIQGGHGGADGRLQALLFDDPTPPDPLAQGAGSWAGAMSMLVGAAANESIATGQPISIEDLLREPVGAG